MTSRAARVCLQEVLHKNYELYRDERNGFSYTVPDGTEVRGGIGAVAL